MNTKPLAMAHDEDARSVEAALIRASSRARAIAAQTRTCIVVVRDGKLVREPVAELSVGPSR
jgi:argonaute-like protein implicated in RNA metabolism and viral defense